VLSPTKNRAKKKEKGFAVSSSTSIHPEAYGEMI
jgi:hypothetical protein